MNATVSHNNGRLLGWLIAVLLLMAFGLGDTAIVVWSASLVTVGQLAAAAIAFGLIGTGVLITVWRIDY